MKAIVSRVADADDAAWQEVVHESGLSLEFDWRDALRGLRDAYALSG